MIKVRHSAVIHRSVGEVFAFVTDIGRNHEWVTGAMSNRSTCDAPFGVGATFEQVGEFMGHRFTAEIMVTHLEQDQRFSYKSLSGPLKFEQHFLFEPEGEDTHITVIVVGETRGFLRMLSGLASGVYRLQLDGDLEDEAVMSAH